MRLAVCLVLASVAAFAAGCGDDDPAPSPRPAETVDKLPKLPPGWKPYVNHRAGFAIGRAPGWRPRRRGTTTLLTSPDHLVAVSISGDRTTEAIEFPLDDYAEQATEALRFGHVDAGRPHRFAARYDAEAVDATGRARSGLRQRLTFIALRRDHVATYAVLVARNAERDTRYYEQEALRMIRTLRGRPVG